MSSAGSSARPTRNERREAAREKAREFREMQKRRNRRNKLLTRGGIIVAVVAVCALVLAIVLTSTRPPGPGPANMASDGIVLVGEGGVVKAVRNAGIPSGGKPTPSTPDNSGKVANIVVYVDYQCPGCKGFEMVNSETILNFVKSGAATLEIHPISALDNASAGTHYSSRATNAAACVANYSPDKYLDFNTLLFANQTAEGKVGLTNAQLKSYAAQAGATGVDNCIDTNQFKSWVQDATNRAFTGPLPNTDVKSITTTPTVLVNGTHYNDASLPKDKQRSIVNADEFRTFVLDATGASLNKANVTPTPTPTG